MLDAARVGIQRSAMEHDGRLNVRLPLELLGRIDDFAAALRERAGVRVSRNEAVRVLLERSLDAAPEMKRKR